ncbi:LOW QUALITY PROTEIN: hypothetical protein MAR_027280 [Mya arenaria]|uniref:Uncharacterized protein n=1 Tax=Mya arenaria TaxID=6604 RepID=A0ABY7ESZ5_MYAAR|nr:LOW QUALITY PROTEIN: hypothetical protein MAR_027280 [Mya arenaria]
MKQRYGQSHKAIDIYMQSIIDLPAPDNCVSSIRNFHDKMETHIRGLQLLGKCQDTYDDMLAPLIFRKLPPGNPRSLTREQGNSQWELQKLRHAIYRCRQCNGKHHTSICEKTATATSTGTVTYNDQSPYCKQLNVYLAFLVESAQVRRFAENSSNESELGIVCDRCQHIDG